MSRLSFRPRPLDIHKKLPIVKSVKDFEDDDVPTTANAATTASSTRNSHLLRLSSDAAEPEVFFCGFFAGAFCRTVGVRYEFFWRPR